MTNPLKSERSASLGLLLARFPIGAFFLVLGVNKLKAGVDAFVLQNIGHVPHTIPHEWGQYYLRGVPYAEVSIGILLIIGLLTRLSAFVASFMIVTFVIGATGLTDMTEPWLPFHPNFIYLGILLALFLVGPGKISLDGLLFAKRAKQADFD